MDEKNSQSFVNFLKNKNKSNKISNNEKTGRTMQLKNADQDEDNYADTITIEEIAKIVSFVSNTYENGARALELEDWQKTGQRRSFKLDKHRTSLLVTKSKSESIFGVGTSSPSPLEPTTKLPWSRDGEIISEFAHYKSSSSFTIDILLAFNNLNSYTDENCPAKRIRASLDSPTQLLLNSPTRTCFCKTIYVILATLSEDTKVLFKQLKPMLLGKIHYAPNTKEYVELIKKANQTFVELEKMMKVFDSSADLINNFLKSLNITSEESIDNYVTDFHLPIIVYNNLFPLNSDAQNNSIDINKLLRQLYMSSLIFKFAKNTMQCLELDKFVPFENEDVAVKVGLKAIENELFWSTLVFQDTNTTDSKNVLPKLVKYKIRMNVTHTHDTVFTQDR